jgi:hypothetical protein
LLLAYNKYGCMVLLLLCAGTVGYNLHLTTGIGPTLPQQAVCDTQQQALMQVQLAPLVCSAVKQ